MSDRIGRRSFLAGSLAATCAVGASSLKGFAAEESAGKRDVYELRVYTMGGEAMAKRAHTYFETAFIPAARRAGCGPVGVFEEINPKDGTQLIYVLIPFPSADAAAAFPKKVLEDEEYLKAGAAFLQASPKDPPYTNLESRLMLAPEFIPKLEVPEKKETRTFELRRYRSPSELAFRKKLEMFGKLGELAIFRRVGLAPVFFGEMLMGPDMPNITYMLTYPEPADKGKAWGRFGADPDWKKLRAMKGYTDPEIIANIKSIMLKPTAYSQI